jgi:transcription elongation factor Elf1
MKRTFRNVKFCPFCGSDHLAYPHVAEANFEGNKGEVQCSACWTLFKIEIDN